jgi:hypothetical protein
MKPRAIRLLLPRLSRVTGIAAVAVAVTIVSAKPVPDNLANGLDKIVENNLIEKGTIKSAPVPQSLVSKKSGRIPAAADFATYKAAVAKAASTYDKAALTEKTTGKYLVDIMPSGRVPLAVLQTSLQTRFPLFTLTSVDTKYVGHGVLEGYVALDDVPAIAKTEGVRSIVLQLRPIHSVGAVTEHGVHNHRVNRINTLYNPAVPPAMNFDGTGISIGVMSDSYDGATVNPGTITTLTRASEDVATGDLPGLGNPVNSQPVVVLQDVSPADLPTDEGRGMCHIVHDIAPKARIGFATAEGGEVNFANNIRALGALPGFTYPGQDFVGNVICDDVSYIDEPMFQDGIVAQGVIDVVNAGKVYASSAANNWGTDGYASVFRPVANGSGLTASTNSALVGTNINLAGVDQALYAGGFHNFNPSGQDVAQTINTANDAGAFIFQWNDPYDTSAPNITGNIFTGSGNSVAGSEMDFGPFNFTAGHLYVITVTSTPQTPADNFDAIVAIIDQNQNVLVDQDTGTDEIVFFFAPSTGSFTVHVHPFAATPPAYTHGPYSVKVDTASNVSGITQDFNCLFFDTAGNFISALGTNAFIVNRPYEIALPTFSADGFTQVQMLISRSNTSAPAVSANQLKYVFFGNGLSGVGPAEYGDVLMPVTYGHSAAAGAQSVAAYPNFKPNIPEDFTSPGPVTIYFDPNSNRLPTPQTRQKPDLAAADQSNNTFFPVGPVPAVTDSLYDPDEKPNFAGTSAASPHAAALSALLLQAHGGGGSLTPAQVRTILQTTAFPHDLDPYVATGTATATNGGTVSINVRSDNSRNMGTGSNNPNTFSVAYIGPGRLATLSFNSEGTAATGGNTTGGNNNSNPTANMPQDFLNAANYHYTPGMIWLTAASNYSFGSSVGLVAGDVTHTYANPAPFPSNPNPNNPTQHMWTLNLAFPGSSAGHNDFTTGKILRFNNGRGPQQDATVPQGMTISALVRDGDFSADMLGDGVLIPEYADSQVVKPGMTFSGTIVNGATTLPFSGRLKNNVGRTYSPLDGYGFINIEAAVKAPVPALSVVSRKVHGGTPYDINLPINGPAGVECRTGASGHTLVFTFDKALSSAGSASMTQGTASAGTPVVGPNANQVTVNLTGVTNAQHLIVTLSSARDLSDNAMNPVQARMDVLFGDTNGNGSTNATDVSQTKLQSGAAVTAANFRNDVNVNGAINSSDVSSVKAASGTALP